MNNPINWRVAVGGWMRWGVRAWLGGGGVLGREIKYDFGKCNNVPLGYMRGQFLGLLGWNCKGREKGRKRQDCDSSLVAVSVTVSRQAAFITMTHTHRQRHTLACDRTHAAGPRLYDNISLSIHAPVNVTSKPHIASADTWMEPQEKT